MTTHKSELNVNDVQSNHGIIATINRGNVTTHHHYHDAERTRRETSIRIRDSFLFSDPTVDRKTVQAKKGPKVPGTCIWLLEHPETKAAYNSWLRGSTSALWITGMPGKGKTTIALYLAAELEKDGALVNPADGTVHSVEPDLPPGAQNLSTTSASADTNMRSEKWVITFFCMSGDEKRDNAAAVLRGVIYQILMKGWDLVNIIYADMEGENKSKATLESPVALWSILAKLIKSIRVPVVYCLIDGLDECDKASIQFLRQKILATSAQSNGSTTITKFQWLMVSRNIGQIRGCTHISLERYQAEIDEDIKRVVAFAFSNVACTVIADDSKTRLEKDVMKNARGTFLWAGYVSYELTRKETKPELLKALREIPKDLDALYDRMLHDIPQESHEKCSALLCWVTLARRPLSLVDLAEALEIKSTPDTTVLEELDFLIRQCGYIIQISENKVSFVHQSAKDYLFGSHDKGADLSVFQINTIDGHCIIASRCIGYLETSKLSTYTTYKEGDFGFRKRLFDETSRSAVERDRAECAFYAYALDHWVHHVVSASTRFPDLVSRHPTFFSLASETCIRSLACRDFFLFPNEIPDFQHAMDVAISEGVLQWAMWIHARWNLWDLVSPHRMNWKAYAMNTAINWSYSDIVSWLLDIGVDVNAETDYSTDIVNTILSLFDSSLTIFGLKRPPLVLYAFKESRYDIVYLLVQRGARIYGTHVDSKTVQKLKDQGCDRAETWFRIIIEHFVQRSKSASVSEFLDWTHHCIRKHKFALVRQLQTMDMKFPHCWKDYNCVLEAAIKVGTDVNDSVHDVWQCMVQQVVDQDRFYRQSHGTAGHNHQSGSCAAPELAVSSANVYALKTLLSYDCFMTSMQSSSYTRTWVSFASSSSHTKTAAILIDHGATNKRTLAWYLELGPQGYEAAELLLSSGVDPNAEVAFYLESKRERRHYGYCGNVMTPLDYGESMHDDTIIALLTRFGATRSSQITDAGEPSDIGSESTRKL